MILNYTAIDPMTLFFGAFFFIFGLLLLLNKRSINFVFNQLAFLGGDFWKKILGEKEATFVLRYVLGLGWIILGAWLLIENLSTLL